MNQPATHLADLEQALLDPDVRSDMARVSDLLADDFFEFGSSGRVWTREATVAGLAAERSEPEPQRIVSYLRVRMLAETAALVTYALTWLAPGEPETRTLRSSVWQCEDGKWRMAFHQGTVAA